MKYIGALFMFLVLTNNVNGQIGCPLKIINSDNDCIYDGLKTDEDGKIVYSYHKQYGKIFDFYEFNSDGICISCAYTFQTFDDYSEFIKILESKTYKKNADGWHFATDLVTDFSIQYKADFTEDGYLIVMLPQ